MRRADDNLTGVYADPHRLRAAEQTAQAKLDRERGVQGTLRMILLSGGRTERSQHRVPGELLNGAA